MCVRHGSALQAQEGVAVVSGSITYVDATGY